MVAKKVLVLVFLLVASCFLFAQANAETKELTLELPSYQAEEPGYSTWWKWNIANFEEKHPGVKIKLVAASYEPHHQDLQARCATGTAPDLIHLSSRYFYHFAEEGWLEPLDKRLESTDIPSNWGKTLDFGKYKGETYAITLCAYAYGLFYNQKMFDEAGVKVPTTFGELVTAAQALTKDKNGDGRTDQFGLDMFVVEASAAYMLSTQMLIGNGTNWVSKDGELQFTKDPKIADVIKTWRSIVKNGWSPIGMTDTECRKHFMSGNAAMLLDGAWVAAMIKEADPEVAKNIRVARYPVGYMPGGPSNCIGISSSISPERKELAWDFIVQLCSQESQEMYAKCTFQPAPRKSALTKEIISNSIGMDVFAASQAEVAGSYLPVGYESHFAEFSNIVAKGLVKLATTDADVSNVLAEMEAGVKAIKK